MKKPELMAPAGNWIMLRAAVKNGADAVYFGTEQLNMRAKAKNFQVENLTEIVEYCRSKNVKTYLTVNTIVYEHELDKVAELIAKAKSAGIDMIICWDLSVIEICNKRNMSFAVSTQASVSNSLSAEMYKRLGAKRIVLARECFLEDVKKIKSKVDIEIETFIHGAMCIAVSGRCFMSHHLFGKSANRGECIQPCRREYRVSVPLGGIIDKSNDKSIILGEDYVLSPEDICSVEFIDQLIEAGIDSFKIEGRKRSPEYAAKVVSVYRRAIDLYFQNKLTLEIKKELLEELGEVYNRGFSSGFYFGTPGEKEYAGIHGSKATTRKEYIGKVINYYKKPKAAEIILETGVIKNEDKILIIGQTTGVVEFSIEKILLDDVSVEEAVKGDRITIPCNELIRANDQVYVIKQVGVKERAL